MTLARSAGVGMLLRGPESSQSGHEPGTFRRPCQQGEPNYICTVQDVFDRLRCGAGTLVVNESSGESGGLRSLFPLCPGYEGACGAARPNVWLPKKVKYGGTSSLTGQNSLFAFQ